MQNMTKQDYVASLDERWLHFKNKLNSLTGKYEFLQKYVDTKVPNLYLDEEFFIENGIDPQDVINNDMYNEIWWSTLNDAFEEFAAAIDESKLLTIAYNTGRSSVYFKAVLTLYHRCLEMEDIEDIATFEDLIYAIRLYESVHWYSWSDNMIEEDDWFDNSEMNEDVKRNLITMNKDIEDIFEQLESEYKDAEHDAKRIDEIYFEIYDSLEDRLKSAVLEYGGWNEI